MPESLIENAVDAPEKQSPLASIPAQPESPLPTVSEAGEPEDINRGRPLRSFVRKLFGFDSGTKPSHLNNRIYQLTPEYPAPSAESAPTILGRDREGWQQTLSNSLRNPPTLCQDRPPL